MDVTPHELRTVELREAWRGYRQDDVDDLFDRVASTIERLQAQVERLSDRLARAEEEAGLGKEADEMLRRTLLLAQRTADAAVAEARERARRVLSEAEAQAHSVVAGAEEEARRITVSERQRIEAEIRDLARRRDLLSGDVDTLERLATDYRRRLREFIEGDLAALEARTVPVVPPRPSLHHVEVPPEDGNLDASIDEHPSEAATSSDPTVSFVEAQAEAEAGPAALDATGELAIEELDALEGSEAVDTDEPAADGADIASDEGDRSDPAPDREAREAQLVDADDDEFLDLGFDEPSVTDLLPRRRGRRRQVPEGPGDDYFADLRQAVEEDAPLGPRDDEPGAPHDPQDAVDDDLFAGERSGPADRHESVSVSRRAVLFDQDEADQRHDADAALDQRR